MTPPAPFDPPMRLKPSNRHYQCSLALTGDDPNEFPDVVERLQSYVRRTFPGFAIHVPEEPHDA